MSGKVTHVFTQFATDVSRLTGRPLAFVVCCALVALWAISGPLFGFSDTWQLVINTSTTIVTFLMVFLIQNTQNRDGVALQTKLDELIRATTDAENEFIGIEKLTDKELEVMHARCKARADRSMRALQRAAAEKDARVAKSSAGARKAPAKSQPSAKARAASRAKALKAGRSSE